MPTSSLSLVMTGPPVTKHQRRMHDKQDASCHQLQLVKKHHPSIVSSWSLMQGFVTRELKSLLAFLSQLQRISRLTPVRNTCEMEITMHRAPDQDCHQMKLIIRSMECASSVHCPHYSPDMIAKRRFIKVFQIFT